MLQLRADQMRALRDAASRNFTSDMCQRIVERFPKKTADWDDFKVRSIVDAGIQQAEARGIVDRNDIWRYLEYFVEFDREFGTSQESLWAASILESEASGTRKMDLIDDQSLARAIAESK